MGIFFVQPVARHANPTNPIKHRIDRDIHRSLLADMLWAVQQPWFTRTGYADVASLHAPYFAT